MGTWQYYMVRMTMRDVAKEVRFASELLDDPSLDAAIKRTLNSCRESSEIALFLKQSSDRFMSSLVVAALGGDPLFYPVSLEPAGEHGFFTGPDFDQAFGILRFNADRKYYALEGQHRLKAIKSIIESIDKGEAPAEDFDPEEFSKEQMSILLFCANRDDRGFKTDYRRLRSSLNRHSRPTGKDANILMDEDDAVAMLTRRLINDHEFFKTKNGCFRVQTKGGQLKRSRGNASNCYTSLQTLYAMNETFLVSRERGLGKNWRSDAVISSFKKVRPNEVVLDLHYAELENIWDSLTAVLPELHDDPASRRDLSDAGIKQASLLFMPCGQEILAKVARALLDGGTEASDAKELLAPLNSIKWNIYAQPWKYLFLAQDSEGAPWKMISADRQPAQDFAVQLVLGLLGKTDAMETVLFEEWCGKHDSARSNDKAEEVWNCVEVS